MPASPQDRYDTFVESIKSTGEVWGLNAGEGCIVVDSVEFEDTEVMPFWPDEDSAKAVATEDWSEFTPELIPLEEFLENWLPGLHEDGLLVGANWDEDMVGLEVEPADLSRRLMD